jgi:hypothetical protein
MPPAKKRATQTPSNRRPTPRNADLAAKERKALDLRIAGATFDQIAEKLEYADKSAAYRAVTRALVSTVKPAADELRELEVARLDRLLLAVWPDALGGDPRAVANVLKIIDQRAKFLGLHAPTQVDVSATVTVDPADIEIVQRIRAWRDARST